MISKFCFPLLLLLFVPAAASGGEPPRNIKFRAYTHQQGISDNFVRSLIQDHLGYIWVGTQNGLNRFDGYRFDQFKNNPRDQTSLAGNQVMCLFEDSHGTLWIGTDQGLSRFERDRQTFQRVSYHTGDSEALSHSLVLSVAEDTRGNLWVGTYNGLNRLDPSTGRVQPFYNSPHFPGSISNNQINALLVDRKGRLWVGTANGLDRYDAQAGNFTHFQADPDDKTRLYSNEISCLFEDDRGRLWVGSLGGGVALYDEPTNKFITKRRAGPHSETFHDNVSGIAQDQKGDLWITTFRGISFSGLHHYDMEQDRFIRYFHEPDNPHSLSWSYSTAVMVDRSGILWAGSSRGLDKYDLESRKFPLYKQFPDDMYNIMDNYYGVYVDDQNRVWMGLDLPAFVQLDRNTGKYKTFYLEPVDSNNLTGGGVYGIAGNGNGLLWIGHGALGLRLFDPRDEHFVRSWRHDPTDSTSLTNDLITCILPSGNGNLWVGTSDGLGFYDQGTDSFRSWRHDFNDPVSLSGDRISALYEDRQGTLWLGTGGNSGDAYMVGSNGLNRMSWDRSEFSIYKHDPKNPRSISSNWIYAIFQDSRGLFWIGTSNGLNLMDQNTETFTYYLQKDGLPNDTIVSILEDDSGQLWLSTQNGLSCFDPVNNSFRNFDADDGLQQYRFNAWSFFKTLRGEIFLGGTGGLNAFFPDQITRDPFIPPIILTDFRLFDKEVPVGMGSPQKRHISRMDEMVLKHDQNSIGLSFSALHFSSPEKNQYAFYLENYEDTWRKPGFERRAEYTNLDPGNYTFRVKASNKDGVWNQEGVSLKVKILPPWWQTIWAGFMYVLLISAIIYGLIRIQIERTRRKLLKEAEQAREESRLREADLARLAAEAQARALEADHRRKTEELEQARRVQLSMLPRDTPSFEHLEISAQSTTATEVGGDYYDFDYDGNRLTVAIGDATGHGMQAGIMVAATKSLFNAMSRLPHLTDILRQCSAALKGMGIKNMYMGLTLARFEGDRVDITSAGMPFPTLWRAAANRVEPLELRAMPLGAILNFDYQTISIHLEKNDLLLFCSDGLPETFNAKSEILGVPRVQEALQEHAGKPVDTIVKRLLALGEDWAGARGQDDDVTLVVVRFT